MTAQLRIGIIGLGKMGSAFARRFISQGRTVSVWDRTPQHADALGSDGAKPYASLDEMLQAIDIAIVMLWGDEVAREVTLGQVIPRLQPGQTLVEMSTLSPAMYDTLEQAARSRNIAFVASPVLGNPDVVRDGALTVLAGGEKSAVESVRPILASLGNVVPMPTVRASGYLKLANNVILAVTAETLGELLALCDRAGIDHALAVQMLMGTFERVVKGKEQPLLERDSQPRFALGALYKDLQLARGAAGSLGESMPVFDATISQVERAMQNGLGERDYIVLAIERDKPVPVG